MEYLGFSTAVSCHLLDSHVFNGSSHGRRGYGALLGLSDKALNSFMRVAPSCPNHLQKALVPNTIILGIRFSHVNLGGGGQGFKHFICSSNCYLRESESIHQK